MVHLFVMVRILSVNAKRVIIQVINTLNLISKFSVFTDQIH